MSYRYALQPRWVLSHLFALACIALFVTLGMWQLDRHDQRVERNSTYEARTAEPVLAADEVVADGEPDELRFRRLVAEGTFDDAVLVVDNRSLEGMPGGWVLSPLRLDDGTVLVVNRGFEYASSGLIDPPGPPGGSVQLEGTATRWERDSCGIRRGAGGEPAGTACLNPAAATEAFGVEVAPVVLQAGTAEVGADLQPVPPPELDDGAHRSYAVQWFIFATLTVIVYVLILRRRARATEGEAADRAVTDVTSDSRT